MHTITDHARPHPAAALQRTATATLPDSTTLVQHWTADDRRPDGWIRLEWITRTDVTRETVHAPVTAYYAAGRADACRADWQAATDALTALHTTRGATLTGDLSPLPPSPYAIAYDTPPTPRHARRARHAAPGRLTLDHITDPAFNL